MRALPLLLGLAVLASGCLSAADVQPSGLNLPLKVQVHREGLPVTLDPGQVLGSAVDVVQKVLPEPGAEPNIGVTSSGAIFITAFDYVMRSTDGGDTWEAVYEFGAIHPPAGPRDPIRDSDPMLWVDPDTDRIFAPMMWPPLVCSQAAYSDDDGATWYDRPFGCGLPGIDHQKLATGPYVAGSALPRTGDYPNVVYFCYNAAGPALTVGGSTRCAMSTDGGETFPVDNEASANCGGINGHPATAPDGTVYVPLGFNCGTPHVAVSEDNGMTWDERQLHVGGLGNAELDPEVAVTPDGTAYYFWRGAGDHRMYVVRSTDQFATVSRPVMVSPPDVLSTRFAAMSAGDDGTLAFAYLGTRDSPGAPGDAYDDARWHLFTTFTRDATADQPTFVTVQVTPEDDPVQLGYMWESGGGDPARNLLDFIDSVIGPDGRFHVAFTDGCTEDCAGNATATKAESRARNVSLAIQVGGPVLRTPAPAAAESPARDVAVPALPVRPGGAPSKA